MDIERDIVDGANFTRSAAAEWRVGEIENFGQVANFEQSHDVRVAALARSVRGIPLLESEKWGTQLAASWNPTLRKVREGMGHPLCCLSGDHGHSRQGRDYADGAGAAEMLLQEKSGQQNGYRGIERADHHSVVQASELTGADKNDAAEGVENSGSHGNAQHWRGHRAEVSAEQNESSRDH